MFSSQRLMGSDTSASLPGAPPTNLHYPKKIIVLKNCEISRCRYSRKGKYSPPPFSSFNSLTWFEYSARTNYCLWKSLRVFSRISIRFDGMGSKSCVFRDANKRHFWNATCKINTSTGRYLRPVVYHRHLKFIIRT